MPLAGSSIQSASSAHIAQNCLEIIHSSWKRANHTVKPIGMSCLQQNALPVASLLKLAIDGLKP